MSEIEFYRDNDLPFFELKSCNTSALSYKKHAHEEYSIGIVDQGKSRFWYEGKVDEVHSKTMVFLPPDLVHSCNPVNRNQWEYKMLYVRREWVQGLMESRESNILNNPIVKNVSKCGNIKTVSRILENVKAKINPLEKEASILAVFELALSGEKKVCPVNVKSEQPKLKITKEYLQNYFTQKVTLDQLEQVSGVNKFHIIRLFKEQFKIPPHAFQTMLRINYAKKELGKNRQTAEIALDAGFYDQSHFIKVFKSYTGVTPDRYQKLI